MKTGCYCMDCMEGMAQFPDGFFDLAVVDPPYFSGPERRGYYGSKVSRIGVHRDYPVSPKWDVPGKEYFDELLRVSRHYIVWGCNYFDYRFAPGRIVWDKCNANTSFSDCEIAATDLFSSVRLFRFMWNGMMQGKSIAEGHIMQGNKALNEKRIHPTQKPVALYDWIFREYAEPGQRILDTHLGSGSSRIAAYNAGLEFTGFEISPEYYGLQEQRFQEYTAQQDMFHLCLSERGRNNMSKAVLISIRPEWCKKIAAGQKNVEIRKTAPNLERPFKCYIYCTKSTHFVDIPGVKRNGLAPVDGKVIGEFTCYNTTVICHVGTMESNEPPKLHVVGQGLLYKPAADLLKAACMSEEAVEEYLKGGSGFGWGISDLRIYDRPHELCEFTGLRKTRFGMEPVILDRPPQSWRYIEMAALDGGE